MSKFSIPDRVGAACGAVFIVLIGVGNGLDMGGSSDPHPSGDTVLTGFSESPRLVEKLGFAMEVLGFVAFMFFLGWLVSVLRDRHREQSAEWGWLTAVATVAGGIALAVKISSIAPMLAGYVDHADLTPGLARVLMDINSASFVIFTLPYAVFMLAASGSMLATGFVGRVLGWSGLVIGAAGIILPLPTQLDPVNTIILPWMLGMLWTLCLGIRLAWKGPRAAGRASVEPVAVPA